MDAKNAVASREVFDKWTAARLAKCIDDPGQRAKIAEQQYPRTTAQAVAELRSRGFNADEPLLLRFAERLGVKTFGVELAWHKTQIDEMADFCERANKLMVGTRHRITRGISWEQDYAD